MDYTKHMKSTQREKDRPEQVENNAGGFVFQTDDWSQLERFLILGSEGGTYYCSERKLTRDNAQVVQRCLDADPVKTLRIICEVLDAKRAPRRQPSYFAIAMALGQPTVSMIAREVALKHCWTATDLMTVVNYCKAFRGWGRALRRLVQDWYLTKSADQLAYQVAKYRNREGYTHRDLLRLGHPKPTEELASVLAYAAGKPKEGAALPKFLEGFLAAQEEMDPHKIAKLVTDYGLTWEMIPSSVLNEKVVWEALLPNTPPTALLRNLGRLAGMGYRLDPSDVTERVSKEHPIKVIVAMLTYKGGRGRSGASWSPDPRIVDALDDAYHLSFGTIESTGKRYLLALDVSGSMGWSTAMGVPCSSVAAAMAMVTARTESDYRVMGFANEFRDLGISAKQRLDDVVRATSGLTFGSTDCAMPMLWAKENGIKVDVFAVYTDDETWAGDTHPHVALELYRQKMGINAKQVVVGMTATNFTIADPTDPGTLDVVGMDSSVPGLISDFAAGRQGASSGS